MEGVDFYGAVLKEIELYRQVGDASEQEIDRMKETFRQNCLLVQLDRDFKSLKAISIDKRDSASALA